MKIKKFVQEFHGSSFPALTESDNGNYYVVKMRGSGNGPISLLSEFIANKAACKLGWNVPNVDWIWIPENYPWTFGTDEFDDILQKSWGWNLAIEFITNSIQYKPFAIKDFTQSQLDSIYSLDLFFMNVDRTTKSNNFLVSQDGIIYFIDHGSMALFQKLFLKGTVLFTNHIFNELQINGLTYDKELNNLGLFMDIIELIPLEIIESSNFTKETLTKIISDRIIFLSNI